jgi:kynureninase
MNSGPGAVAGAYVHNKHGNNPKLNRFAGWWGYHEETRFKMTKGFVPMTGAAGWQLANGTIISMACVKASLDLFTEVKFSNLVQKSKALTAYLEACLKEMAADKLTIITPESRGCQLSLRPKGGKAFFTYLMENGVICDWREPDVVRLAPTPLYNTFEDCYRAAEIISRFKG